MGTITLRATPRVALGRRARRVRNDGNIPAVVYGREVPARAISVTASEFARVYRTVGEATVLDLVVEGAPPVQAIVQEVARDPVSSQPIHVDFHAVSMTEEIHTRIPLAFVGVAPAVKEAGGVVVRQFDHVEVEALASALVREIAVDLTPLARVGDAIRIRDLAVPPGIRFLHGPEDIVASVREVTTEVEAVPTVTPETVAVVTAKKEKERAPAEAAPSTEAKRGGGAKGS